MNLDIRIPIGGMFSILGALMVIYGLLTSGNEMYHRSLDMNINVTWGGVMLAFGVAMLVMGLRSRPTQGGTETSGERREHH